MILCWQHEQNFLKCDRIKISDTSENKNMSCKNKEWFKFGLRMCSTKFCPKRSWTNISENGEENGQKMIMKKMKLKLKSVSSIIMKLRIEMKIKMKTRIKVMVIKELKLNVTN